MNKEDKNEKVFITNKGTGDFYLRFDGQQQLLKAGASIEVTKKQAESLTKRFANVLIINTSKTGQ
jgi:hypothetical protein